MIYFAYFVLSHFIKNTFSYATPLDLLVCPQFYLIVFLLNAIVFLFDTVVNYIIRTIYITDVENMLLFKKKLERMVLQARKEDLYT
jgi:hypothetical protein